MLTYGGETYLKKIDSEEDVEAFLRKTRLILNDNKFNIHRNFYLKIVRATTGDDRNKTTMLDLNYTTKDVVEELKKLTVEDYKETVIDNMPGRVQPFFCFVKYIIKNQVYIKFKISEERDCQVFCVSFHFADFYVKDSEFPYKKRII